MTKKASNQWYNTGLAFQCRECGNCCSGPEEGYVWLNNDDIQNISNFLNLSTDQFKKKYLRRVGNRYSLIEKQPSKDCIFLTRNNNGGKSCDIYHLRPIQCRTWPFWADNLDCPQSWTQAAVKCPGINRGQWHPIERIQAILKGQLQNTPQPTDQWAIALQWIKNNQDNSKIIEIIEQIYQTLDDNLQAAGGDCQNCGQCCHFSQYGHRLYVTTLEMLFFAQGLTQNNHHPRQSYHQALEQGTCPFLNDAGCQMRTFRPAGCRIFFCQNMPIDFQNELCEQVITQLRSLHEQLNAPYCYGDWLEWLNRLPDH